MLDLSFLVPRKEEPWYELELHQLKELNPSSRDAHIRSMKYSQMHDYKKQLRVVVDHDQFPELAVQPVGSVTPATFNKLPSIVTALQVADEVVIRQGGVEQVLKDSDGVVTPGLMKSRGVQPLVKNEPADHAPQKTAPSGRAWNWDDE